MKANQMDDQAQDQRPEPTLPRKSPAERRAAIQEIVQRAQIKRVLGGADAAHSGDFLYGEDGLPV